MFGWFKGGSIRADEKEKLSPEVEAIFRKIDRLMNDEEVQNEQLPEPFRSEVCRGISCDELVEATGEFGRVPQNPIPVNGPIGELIYLSNLRTTNQTPVLFHRLGSIARVDIFELVSFDGSTWDILFFDLYHPRKSRRAPVGYQIANKNGRAQLFFGTNEFVEFFPDQLSDAIANAFERVIGIRMCPSQIRELVEKTSFRRPSAHQADIESLLEIARTGTVSIPHTPTPRAKAETQDRQHQKVTFDETIERFSSLIEDPLVLQLVPKFMSLREAFSSIMTDKKAAGYVFGFHDALAQRLGLVDATNATIGSKLIEFNYKNLFGAQAGFALFEMSVHHQKDPDFHKGRMIGRNELSEFIDKSTPPMGLNRILIFHLDC